MANLPSESWTPALDEHFKRKLSLTEAKPRHFFGRDRVKTSKNPITENFDERIPQPCHSSAVDINSSEISTDISKLPVPNHTNNAIKPLGDDIPFSGERNLTQPSNIQGKQISGNGDPQELSCTVAPPEKKHLFRKRSPKNPKHTEGRKNDAEKSHSPLREGGAFEKKYGTCRKGSIGKGSSAIVRLAQKIDATSSEEKLYAVKEFRKRRRHETEKDYKKKLISEFCISSTLHHPNIVETVELIQDDNNVWCQVMEFMNGGDLYNAIRSGHMSTVEIDCCFKQIISGVAYLHAMGVAHRDIKPENLLLDDKGHLKITDFGVSDVFRMCWEKQPRLSEGICGSEPYIAPEQFEEQEYDARKCDVWSCGIVYYCMVSQSVPFRCARTVDYNYQQYLEEREMGSSELFDRLSPGARALLYRILDPNPKTRCTIDDILKDEWFTGIKVCQNGKGVGRDHVHVLNPIKRKTSKL